MSAAPDLKRVTLELGGNDPAIVLDDADPAVVATAIFAGAFNNNGQVCSAIKRVYVPEALYDDVRRGAGRPGPADQGGRRHRGRRQARPDQQRARSSSGSRSWWPTPCPTAPPRPPAGTPWTGPGYFFEPTILTDLSDGTRIVDEEQFGPALPVIPYRDVGRRRRAGQRHPLRPVRLGVGRRRRPGRRRWPPSSSAARPGSTPTWPSAPQQPFGGFKWSGVGVENGPWGLAEFTEIQAVHRSKAPDGLNLNTASLLS